MQEEPKTIITALEFANVKRIRAVELTPAPTGLTVIGGRNAQGKTSCLDAIAFALGGERRRPTSLKNEDGISDPYLRVELTGGILVERKGKNSSLTVTDSTGVRQGQKLLDAFLSEFALDLPKFLALGEEQKALVLLQNAGLDLKLEDLATTERALYDKRRTVGQIATQKAAAAKALPEFGDAPDEEESTRELLDEITALAERNADRQRRRMEHTDTARRVQFAKDAADEAHRKVLEAQRALEAAQHAHHDAIRRSTDLEQQFNALPEIEADESDELLVARLKAAEDTNAKVRANLLKRQAQDEAADFQEQYAHLDLELSNIRDERRKLLAEINLPLPGLEIAWTDKGRPVLAYNNRRWDSMATSEQLKVGTAIAAAQNDRCGFVLLDRLEALDLGELKAFGDWLAERGLQAICTRVSTGGECSIIIEDGCVAAEGGVA